MAIYNEILVGRFQNALKKHLSMKGPSPAPALSSEIAAVLNFFYGAENRYLEQWSRFGCNNSLAAGGAGNFGAVRLRNPATSNVVAVVEKCTVYGALTDTPRIQLAPQAADYAVGGLSNRMDARGAQQPALQLFTSTAGVNLSATIGAASFPANQAYDFINDENQEIPILPGDAFQVISNVANQAFNCMLFWRERFLEDSERA
jgi:hypothetical protein